MACDLATGRGVACKSIGGIKHIELANWNDGGATIVANKISALGTSTTFYKYDVRGANNSVDEAGESSRDNNSKFTTISGTIQLPYPDEDTRAELDTISKTKCFMIVEDYNGERKLYGLEDGLDIAVGSSSGASMGDFNGFTLTVNGVSPNLAWNVQAGASNIVMSGTQITPN